MFVGNLTSKKIMDKVKIDKDIRVLTIKAETFPGGVMAAHKKIHKLFPVQSERRFFGISWMGKNNEIVYYAAAEELYPNEAEKYSCETFTILKGDYCGKYLKDWCVTPNLVGDTFRELLQDPELDPNGYCLEIYHNENDMECLVKLK